MSLSDERRVYQGEEPELFREIEHLYAERGSWVTIDGRVCIILEVTKNHSAVIVERLEEP